MKVTQTIALATAILIGLIDLSAVSAASDNVQVFRAGLASGIVDSVEADVRVFRGSGDVQVADDITASVQYDTTPQVVAAGSRVWLVNHTTQQLTVCRLRKTLMVSEYVVACKSRDLPY
jgi:hypothetical protein